MTAHVNRSRHDEIHYHLQQTAYKANLKSPFQVSVLNENDQIKSIYQSEYDLST